MSITRNLLKKPNISCLLHVIRLSNPEVYDHCLRVSQLTEYLLPFCNIPKSMWEDILTGCLLHDIGKGFLPFNLSGVSRKLETHEFIIVKTHTAVSYEIVKDDFSKTVGDICLLHHEYLDGSGYLLGLTKKQIPDYVQLVQVIDIYDALSNSRPYKEAYDKEATIAILEQDARKKKISSRYVKKLKKYLEDNHESTRTLQSKVHGRKRKV